MLPRIVRSLGREGDRVIWYARVNGDMAGAMPYDVRAKSDVENAPL